MTQQNERLPAFGEADPSPDGDSDFAGEHDSTTVDKDTLTGEDGEQESPRGWSGQEREGPP